MSLRDFLSAIVKSWYVIVLLSCIGALAGFLLAKNETPMYEAEAQVFVSVRGGDNSQELLQGSNFISKQVKSYIELVHSPLVLEPVLQDLGLDMTSAQLASQVKAGSPLDTVLINIKVTTKLPEQSSDIANGVASSLATVVSELESRSDGQVPVKVTPSQEAIAPNSPVSPDIKQSTAFGFILGLAISIVYIVLRLTLDTRVREIEDVDDVSTYSRVGTIHFDQDAPVHPLIIQDSPYTLRSEAFRRLRTNLQFLDVEGGAQTITVTSAIPGEGKSTTAMNLAIALADAGSRVIIVDADLRRPTVGKIMALPEEVGLTTVLIGKASIDDVTQPWAHDNLSVMTCGAIPPNPSELLGSVAMTRVIEELKEKYDIVIFDTAPLVPVTDGAVLAKLTDGALLVVGTGTVNKHQVKEAIDALEKVGARILGIVANRVPVSKNKKKDQYGYYYGYTNRDFDGKKERRKGKKKHNKELQQPLVVEEIKPKVEKPKEPQVLTPDPVVEGHPWSGETVTGAIPTVTAKTATKAKEGKSSEQQDFSSLLKPRHAVTKD